MKLTRSTLGLPRPPDWFAAARSLELDARDTLIIVTAGRPVLTERHTPIRPAASSRCDWRERLT
ncbi:MAG TPA: hypothetical protein VGM76_01815 [Lacipirellulaceae bacterium]